MNQSDAATRIRGAQGAWSTGGIFGPMARAGRVKRRLGGEQELGPMDPAGQRQGESTGSADQ